MSTRSRNMTIMLGLVLLSIALLACGPLALLDRSNKLSATEAAVVVEQPSPTRPPQPTPPPPSATPAPTATAAATPSPDAARHALDAVQVTDLLFFGCGADLPAYGERTYATTFARASTRYIAWELNLDYPEPGEQVDFEIYAIWYGPDGQVLTEQTMADAFLGADWTSSAHALGFGWDDAEEWDLGAYTVELYAKDRRIAAGDFEIVDQVTDNIDAIDSPETGMGGRIAFTSDRDGNPEIYVMNVVGDDVTRLTNSPEEDEEPAWSPDGERLAFHSYRDGNGELYVVNADGSDLLRLTVTDSDEWSPAWSPDGTWIAFTSNRDGERRLFLLPAASQESDGSDWVRLTAAPGADWKFDWAPDGATLVFDSDPDGARQLYVIAAPAAGGGVDETAASLLVADDNGVFDAAWSPDGRFLAFTASKPMANGRIDLVAADGGGRVTLTEDPAGDAAPTWSPDGNWIAFTSYRDGEGEIYIMAAPGSPLEGMPAFNLTNTTASEGWPAWSPE